MTTMPKGIPHRSMVPSGMSRAAAMASAAAPGGTISSATSRPMAKEPASGAMLSPVRRAIERAMGPRITSATSK